MSKTDTEKASEFYRERTREEKPEELADRLQGPSGVSEILQLQAAIMLLCVMAFVTVGMLFGVQSVVGGLLVANLAAMTVIIVHDGAQEELFSLLAINKVEEVSVEGTSSDE